VEIEHQAQAVEAVVAVAQATRSLLCIYSRELDPGLLDTPAVLDALRALAVRQRGAEIRILMQDPETAQRAGSALITLAQRLPSSFVLRAVNEPVDRSYAGAFVASDGGGYYHRPLGHRFEGEADLHAPGRSRQLREEFGRFWERARPCTELRALGL
jgi:hypothetical protein